MKDLMIALCLLVFSSSALAGVPGKYKLELKDEGTGLKSELVFLMSGESKIRTEDEKGDFFVQNLKVEPSSDVDAVKFQVDWEGDEDKYYYEFLLLKLRVEIVMVKSCSAYVEGPLGFDGSGVVLSKWNSKKRKYKEIKSVLGEDCI